MSGAPGAVGVEQGRDDGVGGEGGVGEGEEPGRGRPALAPAQQQGDQRRPADQHGHHHQRRDARRPGLLPVQQDGRGPRQLRLGGGAKLRQLGHQLGAGSAYTAQGQSAQFNRQPTSQSSYRIPSRMHASLQGRAAAVRCKARGWAGTWLAVERTEGDRPRLGAARPGLSRADGDRVVCRPYTEHTWGGGRWRRRKADTRQCRYQTVQIPDNVDTRQCRYQTIQIPDNVDT
jgi:hypothetical protein